MLSAEDIKIVASINLKILLNEVYTINLKYLMPLLVSLNHLHFFLFILPEIHIMILNEIYVCKTLLPRHKVVSAIFSTFCILVFEMNGLCFNFVKMKSDCRHFL